MTASTDTREAPVVDPFRGGAPAAQRRAATWILGLAFPIAVLFAWQWAAQRLGAFLLPTPIDVGKAILHDATSGEFSHQILATLSEIVGGFAIAALVGTGLATTVASIPLLERVLLPYIVAFQTLPKIALAPLITIWLGYGINSKVAITALVAVFPVFINVVTGFKSIDADSLLLMRSLRASRGQTFFKLKLPAILPYLVAGLKIAIVFAIIGAIVGEFIGSSNGLGSVILQRQSVVNVAGVFSVLFFLCIIGLVLNYLLVLISRPFLAWSDQQADG